MSELIFNFPTAVFQKALEESVESSKIPASSPVAHPALLSPQPRKPGTQQIFGGI